MPIPQWNFIAALVFGLFMLYILSRILYRPLKLCVKIIFHLVLGGAIIVLYNLIGISTHLTVGLNFITAIVVGIMGIPGLLMLIALKYILG